MRRLLCSLLAFAALLALAAPAGAGDVVTVTLDKAKILRLDRPAAIVMLAKPEIADVVLENPRFLFLIGRAAGETSLTILDASKNEILSATLAVVPENEKQISILRHCRSQGGGNCQPEETMSCSGGRCVSIPTPGQESKTTGGAGAGAPN